MHKVYLPVKENSDYVQDPENFALLYNNELEFKNFESRKLLQDQVGILEKDVTEIKEDMKDIKLLLNILVNGKQ
jgi:hypothetical protein